MAQRRARAGWGDGMFCQGSRLHTTHEKDGRGDQQKRWIAEAGQADWMTGIFFFWESRQPDAGGLTLVVIRPVGVEGFNDPSSDDGGGSQPGTPGPPHNLQGLSPSRSHWRRGGTVYTLQFLYLAA